jgi:hypothetical protein
VSPIFTRAEPRFEGFDVRSKNFAVALAKPDQREKIGIVVGSGLTACGAFLSRRLRS